MLNINRNMYSKWIFQKNISSTNLIENFVRTLNNLKTIHPFQLKESLKETEGYYGRSSEGSISTMGVRLSQTNFYMFGYTNKNHFIPTRTTMNLLENIGEINKNMLVNLFSIQFPHPYSNTPFQFNIYAGRLILKLLTENKLGLRLYLDEFIWFVPFIKEINQEKYDFLINEILEFRKLSFTEKKVLFKSVYNYDELFSNILHETNYYFFKIFEEFGVLKKTPEFAHNEGNVFVFKQGKNSYRNDSVVTRKKIPGYIKLDNELLDIVDRLLNSYSVFETPTSLSTEYISSKEDWINDLYEIELMNYLDIVFDSYSNEHEVIQTIKNMVYMSKYSSIDGKDFENSLKPTFELFREIVEVNILSGSGNTDLVFLVDGLNRLRSNYKVNLEAKSRSSFNNINVSRINRHILINNSDYSIIIAPRFTKSTFLDIDGKNIVTLTAETLSKYLYKEVLSSPDYMANYTNIDKIIRNNYGKDVSNIINQYIDEKYGYTI